MRKKVGLTLKEGSRTAYNRAYLASVLRTSAQIPRFARNFRYAQTLSAIVSKRFKIKNGLME